ncbi:MAG: hypothetical protein MI673_09400, partial [Thiotrichales bacterium]|nr:hypothetical protein [Thiotrichales bacterium]
VSVLDDALVESAETVIVTLDNTDNASFTIGAANTDTVTIADNDSAGVTITESGGVTNVAEGGATDTLDYTLDAQPAPGETVTLTITPDAQTDLGSGAGVAVVITFDDTNWNIPQTITVTAVDDLLVEGNHTSTITTTTTSSVGGSPFDGLVVPNVTVNITDNDTAGVSVIESGGSTDVIEGGATDTLDVVLTGQPNPGETVDVVLTPDAQTDLGLGAGVAVTRTFDNGNWNVTQMVTVTAVDDALVEGNHTSTITTTTTSTQPAFDGLTAPDVTVNIMDNDVAGVSVVQSGGSTDVTEGGATDTLDYTLDAQPAPGETVTLTITPDAQTDLGSGAGVPVMIMFNDGNWNIPQSITVTADDDVLIEGAHASTISTTTASTLGGSSFTGLVVADITVNITDNDTPGGGPGSSDDSDVVPENLLNLGNGDPAFDPLNPQYQTTSAEGAVIATVRQLSTDSFGDRVNVDPIESNGFKGFSLRTSITETGAGDQLESLFPLRIGEDSVGAESRDELIVESLVIEHVLYLEISYLINSDPDLAVTEFNAALANGDPLPQWMRINKTTGLIMGEPPVDAETIQLRIDVTLNDGTHIIRYVEVELRNGEISELRDIEELPVVGLKPFSQQLEQVADVFAHQAKLLEQAFQ